MARQNAGHQKLSGRTKYGLFWNYATDSDLDIELWMIRNGGRVSSSHTGKPHIYGEGLFHHYREMQKLLWPEDDLHRWSDLQLQTLLDNQVTVLMGSANCSKTWGAAKFILCDWWAYPDTTLWLVSTTEFRGAELRIWGALKKNFNRAKTLWPKLPGNVLESAHCITTDSVYDADGKARELTKGLTVVPLRKGNPLAAMAPLIGAKSPRLRHCADEASLCPPGFLDAYANWHGNPGFKSIIIGNPTDLLDPLCRAAKPPGGWELWEDTKKTQTWRSEFFDAAVIAFDGRDSPNNDFPQTDKPRFPYLIHRKGIEAVVRTYGADSWQFFMQCAGKPNRMMTSKRVITELLCRQHGALDPAIWGVGKRTMIYGLDPAYGGGDRCIGFPVEFGIDIDGVPILKVHPFDLVPVYANINKEPDDQIADFVKQRMIDLGISPTNCFYDSFGKGTLGNAFARAFRDIREFPVPVDSGGRPTARPVRHDLYKIEKNNERRLVRCDEFYSKFISELWYSLRQLIECDQLREFPTSTMEEGCMRVFSIVAGNKVEVESKADMKERTQGKSPDECDALCIALEGARRRGFRINRLDQSPKPAVSERNSLEEIRERMHSIWKSKTPAYA